MSEKPTSPDQPEVQELKILTEEQVRSLIAQFRYMLLHEVKMMKLEVVESIGNMLARRSGFDKELRDLGGRMEVLAKSVEGFAGRIAELERAAGIAPRPLGPMGRRAIPEKTAQPGDTP